MSGAIFDAEDLDLADLGATNAPANEIGRLLDEQIGGARTPRETAQVARGLRLEQEESLDDRPQSGASMLSGVGLQSGEDAPDPRLGARNEWSVSGWNPQVRWIVRGGSAGDSRSSVL